MIEPRKSIASLAAAAALLAAGPIATADAGGGAGGGGVAAPADHGTLAVDAAADSITASGYQPGAAEVRVTRPDAVTGEPVLIGLFTDTFQAGVPLTVNTTAPLGGVGGDCWEAAPNSLLGWTPDIRAGDTVTFRADTVVVAPSAADDVAGGPVAGCEVVGARRANAPYALNAAATASIPAINAASVGSRLTVSGVAQPFATSVSVTLTDGATSTAPVVAALNAGAWSATFDGADVAKLADGQITVRALYTVPDLATGALHQVAGAPMKIAKDTRVLAAPAAPAAPATGAQPAPGAAQPGGQQDAAPTAASLRVTSLSTAAAVRLARVRRAGLRLSFVVPDPARVFSVAVRHGGRTIYRGTFRATPGARQTVRLGARALRRALRRGAYSVSVRAGLGEGSLGPAALARVRVR